MQYTESQDSSEEDYAQIPWWVLRAEGVTSGDIQLLLFIYSWSYRSGVCWASSAAIGARFGLSESALKMAVSRASGRGLLWSGLVPTGNGRRRLLVSCCQWKRAIRYLRDPRDPDPPFVFSVAELKEMAPLCEEFFSPSGIGLTFQKAQQQRTDCIEKYRLGVTECDLASL